MKGRSGRAYIFVRWSGFSNAPGRLGEVAWAFEYVDRLGRFVCFHCGAVGTLASHVSRDGMRPTWTEKSSSLPELIKIMATEAGDRPGYDEVKVFEIEDSDPDLALQAVQRGIDEPNRVGDPLEETRDILFRYGARGLALSRGFSAPFLWYNILPGRSVAIRKLPVHLFQLRAAADAQGQATGEDVEDQARRMAQTVSAVLAVGECFVARVRTGFIVGINIAVNAGLSVTESYKVSQRVEETIRNANPKIRHIFVQVMPYEAA
jgi:hypothetical protein